MTFTFTGARPPRRRSGPGTGRVMPHSGPSSGALRMGEVHAARTGARAHVAVKFERMERGCGRALNAKRSMPRAAPPHICTIYEVGPFRTTFIVMELGRASGLELVRVRRLPIETFVAVRLQIAEALGARASRRRDARDLKSANCDHRRLPREGARLRPRDVVARRSRICRVAQSVTAEGSLRARSRSWRRRF